MALIIFVVVAAALVNNGYSKCNYPDITVEDIVNLRVDIRNAIDNSTFPSTIDEIDGILLVENGRQPLLASIVRLSFDDCVGRNVEQNTDGTDKSSNKLIKNKCNGCIDFNNLESAGLEEHAVDPLEDIYQLSDNEWYTKMS